MGANVAGGAYRQIKRAKFVAIGDQGLEGSTDGKFVKIKGPCGEGHVMSMEAAAQLRDWLDEVTNGPVAIARALAGFGFVTGEERAIPYSDYVEVPRYGP